MYFKRYMKKNWVRVAKLINGFGKRRAMKGNLGVQARTCEVQEWEIHVGECFLVRRSKQKYNNYNIY